MTKLTMPTVDAKAYPSSAFKPANPLPRSVRLTEILDAYPILLTKGMEEYLECATQGHLTSLEEKLEIWVKHRPTEGELKCAVEEITDLLNKAKEDKGAALTMAEIKKELDNR
tara:strand:- start:85 stop:423 length:339 start_codon:yes stop_codon:yes gene_type:complete